MELELARHTPAAVALPLLQNLRITGFIDQQTARAAALDEQQAQQQVQTTMQQAVEANAFDPLVNPLQAAETMTGHIARISGGDLSYNSIDYNSLFAIALMLFLVTLVLNLVSQWIVNRFRERYE